MWRESIPFWKVMSPCDTQSSSIQCSLFNTYLAKAYNVSAADTVNVLSCNIFIHWPVWHLCLASQRIYTYNNFLCSPYDGMSSHYSHYCSTNSKRTILPTHKGLACLNSSDRLVSTTVIPTVMPRTLLRQITQIPLILIPSAQVQSAIPSHSQLLTAVQVAAQNTFPLPVYPAFTCFHWFPTSQPSSIQVYSAFLEHFQQALT